MLALVLPDTDYPRAQRVVDRLVSDIEHHPFPVTSRIAIGLACYPTHAMGATSLRRWALSHPVATCQGGSQAPPPPGS
jgi:hypothetical protein